MDLTNYYTYYTLDNLRIICIVLICLLFLLLVLFKVKSVKNKQLQKEITRINYEFDNLKQQKEQLETVNQQLNVDLISAKIRVEEREDDIIQLKEQQQETKTNYIKLEEDLVKIKETNSDLFARGQLFQHQATDLKNNLRELDIAHKEINEKYLDITTKYTKLQAEQVERQNSFEQQIKTLTENKQELLKEFDNLSNKIFEERGTVFLQNSQHSLNNLLEPFKQQLGQFQQRINDIHTVSVKGTTALEVELKRMAEASLKISDQAHNLTVALKGDKKLLGSWGEIQLERTLQAIGLVKEQHFKVQQKFTDDQGNGYIPDVVVYLPDDKHLVIDSKVSLVAYDKAMASEDITQEKIFLDEHVKAIKQHIDELSKKDYSNLNGLNSPSFVLMFIPIEPAYMVALQHDPELFNYGYKKNIILLSHTTLLPVLLTVSNLWKMVSGNKEASDILKKAGEIYNQVCIIAERLSKLGNTLNLVTKQYNDIAVGLAGQQGLHSKVEKFKEISNVANRKFTEITMPNLNIEQSRLNEINSLNDN